MIPLSDLVFKLSVFFALLSELQCNEARTTNIKMRDKHHHCGTYNCDGGKRKGIAYHNQVYQIACYQGRGFIDDHANLIWANSTYNGYGCYCGIGGGGRPLDATDSCCMKHDACYDNVKIEYPLLIKQTSQFYNYTYTMKCYQCRNTTSCRYSDNNGAANGLCKCDRKLAICLSSKNASGTYHSGNIGASKKGDCC